MLSMTVKIEIVVVVMSPVGCCHLQSGCRYSLGDERDQQGGGGDGCKVCRGVALHPALSAIRSSVSVRRCVCVCAYV